MMIDYIVSQVEALVRNARSRDPYVICNVLDYKLHYMDLKQRLKAYYFYQSRINNIIVDENNDVIGNNTTEVLTFFKNAEANKAAITRFQSKLNNYTNG